ncbi:MAG: 2-hydroxychromene-2-carboxylate isomerase [Burkholderiaceae bacterium]
MQSVLRFYFDYISPNAYLAWTQLPALAKRHDGVIEPVPVLFAGLLEANRQVGPAEVPSKMRWMWKNTLRKAALLGVELNRPAFHPFNPLIALRVSSLPFSANDRQRLVNALFDAVWVRALHIAEAPVVERVAAEIGLDGARLIADAQQPACKAKLRDQTSAAIEAGVFGVPSVAIGDQIFWGYDDLMFVERALNGTDAFHEWDDFPAASAVRSRSASS